MLHNTNLYLIKYFYTQHYINYNIKSIFYKYKNEIKILMIYPL